MSEQEAREMLNEHLAVRAKKRIGRTLFELRPDGRLDVYTLNAKLTRMWFSHISNPARDWMHPDVRAWYRSRWTDGADAPTLEAVR